MESPGSRAHYWKIHGDRFPCLDVASLLTPAPLIKEREKYPGPIRAKNHRCPFNLNDQSGASLFSRQHRHVNASAPQSSQMTFQNLWYFQKKSFKIRILDDFLDLKLHFYALGF